MAAERLQLGRRSHGAWQLPLCVYAVRASVSQTLQRQRQRALRRPLPQMGFTAAPPIASRTSSSRCQVAGCAAPLNGLPRYNSRYRICEPHLRAASVDIAGVASRWCQTCTRWHALNAFEGERRTCTAQLERLKRRRVAARSAKAGLQTQLSQAGPAAATSPCILLDHDALTSWLLAVPPSPAAQAGLPVSDVDDETFVKRLLGLETASPVRTAETAALWLEHEQPVAHSFALKLPYAPPPHAVPSAPLGAAMCDWAGVPLAMYAVAQPGCVILTVDALSLCTATALAGAPQLQAADLVAAVHAACAGNAGDAAAVRGAAAAVVARSSLSPGWPRPTLRAALLAPHAASLRVPLVAPPQGGVPRARAHGLLLLCEAEAINNSDAGPWVLRVSMPPPPEARPTLLLLDTDVAPDEMAPALCVPVPLLLCTSAAVAAELDALLQSLPAADADAAAHLLGAAMHRGGSRAAPELLHAAASLAARSGCVATLETTLLPALLPLHACFRVDLLAAAAGAAQPAAVRLMLALGGAGGAFGDASSALHAAALAAACSADDAVATRGAEACEVLTAHGAGAAAWFSLRIRLVSNVEATPADVAARSSHPATIALCAALRARRAAARKLIVDAAFAAASTAGPVELRLAAMLQPLLPGANSDASDAATDLAWHLVRRVEVEHAARLADAAERSTLCLAFFRHRAGLALVSLNAFCLLRVMSLSALTPAQLADLATADVQLTWLQYLRLECTPLIATLALGLVDFTTAAALRRLASLPLLRAAHERRHLLRTCSMIAAQLLKFWWTLTGLHELPRVHVAAAAARLVVSLHTLIVFRQMPPRYCAALCLMRVAVLIYAVLAPGCLLLPRSWLTRVTIIPHIAVFLLTAFRAVNTAAATQESEELREKLE